MLLIIFNVNKSEYHKQDEYMISTVMLYSSWSLSFLRLISPRSGIDGHLYLDIQENVIPLHDIIYRYAQVIIGTCRTNTSLVQRNVQIEEPMYIITVVVVFQPIIMFHTFHMLIMYIREILIVHD